MNLKKPFIAPLAALGLLTACETLPQKPEVQAYSTESILAVSTETRERTELLKEFSAWKDEIEAYAQSIKNPEKSAHENMEAIIQYADEQGVKYPALAQFLKKRIKIPQDWFQSFIEFGYFPNFLYHTDNSEFLNPITRTETFSTQNLLPELQNIVPLQQQSIHFVQSAGNWTSRSINNITAFNEKAFDELFQRVQVTGFSIGEKKEAQKAEISRRTGDFILRQSPYFLTSYNWDTLYSDPNQKKIKSTEEASEFLSHSSIIQQSPFSLYKVFYEIFSNRFVFKEKIYRYQESIDYLEDFLTETLEERDIKIDEYTKSFYETLEKNHKNDISEQEINLSPEEKKLLEETILSLLQRLSPEDIAYIQNAFAQESQQVVEFIKREFRPLYNPEWVDEQRFQITDKFPEPIEAQSEKERTIDNFAQAFNTHIQKTQLQGSAIKDVLFEQLKTAFPEDFRDFFENISDDILLRKKIESYFVQYNYSLNFDYQEEQTNFFVKAHKKIELQYRQLAGIQKLFPDLSEKKTTLFIFPGNKTTSNGFHITNMMGLNVQTCMNTFKTYYDFIPSIQPWVSHSFDSALRHTTANELVHDILINEYHFLPEDDGVTFNFQGRRFPITGQQTHEFLSDVGSINTSAEMEVWRIIGNFFEQLKKDNGQYQTDMNAGYGFTNIFMVEKLREIMNARGENIDSILDEIVASNKFLEQHPEIAKMAMSNESNRRGIIFTNLLRKIKKSDIIFLKAHYLAWGQEFMKVIKARKK